jgi:hypothetical protein
VLLPEPLVSPRPVPAPGEASNALSPADRWLIAVTTAVWGTIALLIAWHLRGLAVDDFFITYRYAQNLVAGNGFVFNPGERVFGLSEPGLGLLLAGMRLVTGRSVPSLGTLSTAVGLTTCAALLLTEACRCGRRLEAVVGGTLVVTASYLWVNQGAGVFLELALLLAAARCANRSPVWAGVLAGSAVWIRPDAVAGIALLGAYWLWEHRRERALLLRHLLRGGISLVVIVTVGIIAAWTYFGHPLPTTMAAKQAMLAAGGGARVGFWPRGLPLLARHWGEWWVALVVVGFLGQIALFWRMGIAGRLLVSFALLLDVAYPVLGLPFFSWYVVPFAVATFYGWSFAFGALGRVATKWTASHVESLDFKGGERWGAAVALAIALSLFIPMAQAERRWFVAFHWLPNLETYEKAAEWLHTNSAPTDEVAYVEIGVLAYYSERPIRDLLGLVTPESIPFVQHDDLVGAFLVRPARFVIFHTRGRMGPLVSRPWFARAFSSVARFEQDRGQWLEIYRRNEEVPIPLPRDPIDLKANAPAAQSGGGA